MNKTKLDNYDHSENLAEVKAVYQTKVKAADRVKIFGSDSAVTVLRKIYNPDTIEYTESFYVLLMNRANKVMGWVNVSSGGTSGVICDPKVIFAIALQTNASSIILSHNHPSGNEQPSGADVTMTDKLCEAGKALDLPVLDHIIITPEGGFYSFADEGRI